MEVILERWIVGSKWDDLEVGRFVGSFCNSLSKRKVGFV